MIARLLAVLLVPATLLAGVGAPAFAADVASPFTPEQRAEIVAVVRAALKADPSILRDAVTALQADEAQKHEAAARSVIDAQAVALTRAPGDATAGNPNGDVTVVEFYDVRCPYCRRMLPVVSDLIHRDPNVKIVYKDFPILGQSSVLGAKAVMAAQRQGGYQKLHDALMSGPSDITLDSLRATVAATGLDWDRLQRDMSDKSIQDRIDTNMSLARALGIEGTPAYVIGKHIMAGAVDTAQLTSAIAEARQP